MATGRVPTTANSPLTAKGDLFTYSTAPARLAVGSNGDTIVADSSTATGLRYQTSANQNACINGGMDIFQRGTSFTIASATPQYTADRWTNYFNGTGTIAQETTVKPDTSTNSLKLTATATSADNAIFQLVEQLQMEQFRGKTVTVSLKLAGTVGLTPSITLAYSTTANDTLTNTSTQITPSSTLNPAINASTFVTWALTFTVPTTAKQLRIGIGTGSVVNTNVLYVAEVQLELGSVATTFKKSGGTIQGELAACQRYYYQVGSAVGVNPGNGHYYSSTGAYITTPFPVTMRVAPSAAVTNVGSWSVYSAGSGRAVSAFAFSTSSTISSTNSYTTSGATAGNGGWLESTVANATLAFSAEL